jgi:hypothetical protein
LNLLESSKGSAIDFENDAGFLQLGVIGPHGGYTTLAVMSFTPAYQAYFAPYSGTTDVGGNLEYDYTGFEETGTLTTLIPPPPPPPPPVPEPSALALFALGLTGVGLRLRWRKRAYPESLGDPTAGCARLAVD